MSCFDRTAHRHPAVAGTLLAFVLACGPADSVVPAASPTAAPDHPAATGSGVGAGTAQDAPAPSVSPDTGPPNTPAAGGSPPAAPSSAPAAAASNAQTAAHAGEARAGIPGLPDDAPIYPGAETIEIGTGIDGRVKHVTSSPDSGEQVFTRMSDELEAFGWSIKSRLIEAGQFALDSTKGDRRAAVLIADGTIVETADGATRITVLVTPQAPAAATDQ